VIGRLLYGAAFCALLPALLVLWARRLDEIVSLPVVRSPAIGWGLCALGVAAMLEAMRELRTIGGGLPMNAFPPPRLVSRGIYGIVAHPIYVAFTVAVGGAAVANGSPAGFWIVAPAVALGAAALVLGHERHDLRRRFGEPPRPLLSLPPDDPAPRTAGDLFSLWLLLLAPWLLLYEAIGHLPVPGARSVVLPFETEWPVLLWTEPVYALVYPFVVLAPLALRTRAAARRAFIAGWVGTAIGMLAYLVIPAIAPPRPFEGEGFLAAMLRLERADGLAGRAAFPSFHVFWAWWAAAAWGTRGRAARNAAYAVAAAIVVSCATTGMHAILDLAAGSALAAVALRCDVLGERLRRGAERLANGWREWRFGPVRVIVHGFYAGAAAAAGALIAGALLGAEGPARVALFSAASLVGAGLWGQYFAGTKSLSRNPDSDGAGSSRPRCSLENCDVSPQYAFVLDRAPRAGISRPPLESGFGIGSKTLLRPFGYFGSVVGVALALGAVALAGGEIAPLAAAFAVAAPWVQAIGRLRCLVQGCCHGAPTSPALGIVVERPESRVVRIASLGGRPIHPTPLYSILANIAIGALLARWWAIGASPTLVAGGYLLLSGLARFVEESFRGEPGTPVIRGLRLYQWFAAASALAGAAVTCLPAAPADRPEIGIGPALIATSLAVGVLHAAAMGVDFPASNRRFARLA